jgi:hypothetical protein
MPLDFAYKEKSERLNLKQTANPNKRKLFLLQVKSFENIER